MPRRAAVFGSRGQLGRALLAALAADGIAVEALDRPRVDIAHPEEVEAALHGFDDGDMVVNAAGWTDVRGAERAPRAAFESNVAGAYAVAVAAQRRGCTLIHFSTDYVFDGAAGAPYDEQAPPNPLNIYGATKAAAETLVRRGCASHLIVRVATLFGNAPGRARPNVVDRILADGVERDLPMRADGAMSPTYADDAAAIVAGLIRLRAPFGIYHASNAGSCSWFAFATAIAEDAEMPLRIVAAKGGDDIRRPLASALSVEKAASLGLAPRQWRDGLRRYLATRRAGAGATAWPR